MSSTSCWLPVKQGTQRLATILATLILKALSDSSTKYNSKIVFYEKKVSASSLFMVLSTKTAQDWGKAECKLVTGLKTMQDPC